MPKTRQQLPLELTANNHEQLENYLNNGGIADLAEPLEYLIGQQQTEQVVIEETGRFSAYWQELRDKRLLVVYSNLARIAGLSIILPVESEAYKLTHGQIGASLSPRMEHGHRIRHYAKLGQGIAIGDPSAVVLVQRIAADELWHASGL